MVGERNHDQFCTPPIQNDIVGEAPQHNALDASSGQSAGVGHQRNCFDFEKIEN